MLLALPALLSLGIWLYLFCAHGQFWRSAPELLPAMPDDTPAVDIIVPARDEAPTIGAAVVSLLGQRYDGPCRVIVVDDGSTDGTAETARAAARATGEAEFDIVVAPPKPAHWSGKLWAVSQGVAASTAPLLLLTDADIVHDPRHLATLVARLNAPRVDLVSEMVRLNCASAAERSLVPAFVFFFQMLYPFARVNDAASPVAAAAGGTVLIRRDALQRIGGVAAIRNALIDDVTLAKAVKRHGPIYLGHSGLAVSIRPYPRFADIWQMISRTAFTQLRHSAVLLALTLVGLALVWWVPLAAAVGESGWARFCGICAFALSATSFIPTLIRYKRPWAWALALPVIASFYMAATVSSAVAHWCGRGARWKNRAYGA